MTSCGFADLALGHIRLAEARNGSPVSAAGAEYGSPAGSFPLRAAVAAWQNTTPEEVVITTGASLGLVATLATLPPASSIVVPRPHYPAYAAVAAMLGLKARFYELDADGWQPQLNDVVAAIRSRTTGLILNQPHNPTGTIADTSLLREIAALAVRTNLLVVSDETYGELVFDGAAVPDTRAIFGRSNIVRILSFSKLFGMPGERLGCVIADPSRVDSITRAHWALAMSAPATAQVVALALLRSDPHKRCSALVEFLDRNRRRAIDLLSHCDDLAFRPPDGGCFIWLEVVGCPLDSRSFARVCRDDWGVNVMPGQAFGLERPVYVRASFAVPLDELTAGLERLRCAATRYSTRGQPRQLLGRSYTGT